jgi:hypothetical protein
MHHFVAIPPVVRDQPKDAASDPHPHALPEHTQAIKRWTREILNLNDDSIVTVSEFACSDPGCPLLETVIGVFDEKETRTWKLTRPRVAVTKLMVQQTLTTPPVERAEV